MPKKILIYGLPGAGKTTLAHQLMGFLGPDTVWYNADEIRKQYDDWDFSDEGRLRQAHRMKDLMDEAYEDGFDVICDFVCPRNDYRELFKDAFMVWVDTIKEGRFEDTNKLFEKPDTAWYDVRVTEHREDWWARHITWQLRYNDFDHEAPTTQMMGRFQPWHEGHQALFERALEKTGQVFIMIRDMPESEDNPFNPNVALDNIQHHLTPYAGKVYFAVVPNITHITYGRGVGYKIEQEHFDSETESVSATKIRAKMREDGEL